MGRSGRGAPSDILNRVKSTNTKMEKCKSTPKQLRYEGHYAYDNHSTKTLTARVIITFLSLILTLVNFVFNSIGEIDIYKFHPNIILIQKQPKNHNVFSFKTVEIGDIFNDLKI